MSDWEIVRYNQDDDGFNAPGQSDWEIVSSANEKAPEKESFLSSLSQAPGRIGSDLVQMGAQGLRSLPGYYQAAKTEIPGVVGAITQHPAHAAMQALAGSQELINTLAQAPLGLAQYGANRLNLLPQSVPKAIGSVTPQDTTGAISQLFGDPQYDGEALLRGIPRNAINLYGAGKIASVLNPMKLTAKNIAGDIIKTGEKNKERYGNLYQDLWNDSKNLGLDDYLNNVDIDIKTLKKYSPQKSIEGILQFNKNPTLENAHIAKSDLLKLQRDLNKMPTLRTAERNQLNAVSDGINSINGSMFRDAQGNVNNALLERYNAIQQGYANDVIPYRNKAINKFKRNEISPKELVNSLSKGEFAAKKGSEHPSIKIRNMLAPTVAGAGLLGGSTYIYNKLFGNDPHQ